MSNAAATPVAIPTSSAGITSPGPHAQFAADAVIRKPNQQSPPRTKSPMPPTATLTDAGLTMMDDDRGLANNGAQAGQTTDPSSSSLTATGNGMGGSGEQAERQVGGISPSQKAEGHQASSSLPIPSPPAEVEATLTKLTSHANVAGVLVLSRPEALVIRSGGAYFDPSGPGASERAIRLKSVVEMVRNAVQTLERDVPKTEMGYELMLSPSEKYILVVIQDPTVSS